MTITPERLEALFAMQPARLTLRSMVAETHDGYVLERLAFTLEDGQPVRGLLTRPAEQAGPLPAIIYAHAHGGDYKLGASELMDGRKALLSPLGPVFAEAGYVTLAIDMPTFGERSSVTESAAAKAAFWYGRTLFGQMLSEQRAVLDYLAGRADVDPGRIGMFGISMGATLGYWLGAVEPRLAAIAHLCCYADFGVMVALGAHDGHGIYLSIPGLLNEASNGEIAGLVAPRPQLIALGEADRLTPPAAIDKALPETRAAYERAGAADRLTVLREPGIGHQETERMRTAVFDFFARYLKGQS
jgi:dienelactone hydrolase